MREIFPHAFGFIDAPQTSALNTEFITSASESVKHVSNSNLPVFPRDLCSCPGFSLSVPAIIYKVSEDITVNEGSNVTLTCLANGRPDPSITWRLLNPSGEREPISGSRYHTSSAGLESIATAHKTLATISVRLPFRLTEEPSIALTWILSACSLSVRQETCV